MIDDFDVDLHDATTSHKQQLMLPGGGFSFTHSFAIRLNPELARACRAWVSQFVM